MKRLIKKSLALMIALTMMFGSAPLAGFVGLELPSLKDVFANKAEASTYGVLTYVINNGQVKLIDCDESASGKLVIPSTLGGYPVTSIGGAVFGECTELTSVTIPDSVTSIGDYAFYKCTRLTSVTIGNGVTSIGDDAFYNCTDLTSIYYTGDIAGWCSIEFNNSSSHPKCYAYNLYISGKKVEGDFVIPDSVTNIGDYVFLNCTRLTSVTIGNGVTSIGSNAFYHCTGLKSVYYTGDIAGWCSIDFNNSASNPTYYANILYIDGQKVEGDFVIPDSVTSIGHYAFYQYTGLTSVTIGDSVTNIGNEAFYNCTGLTSVTIPDSVTSIGSYAFYSCVGLTSVTIPDSVTSIGSDAFYNTGLYNDSSNWENGVLYIGNYLIEAKTTISGAYTIKSGTKTIADETFYKCTGLTNITIPDSVTNIGRRAFLVCDNLTSVTIPDSVTSIGDYAFLDCTKLTSVTIPDSVTSIGSSAFYNTGLFNDSSNWENSVLYIGNYLIEAKPTISGDYVIKSGTKVIVDGAFNKCFGLTSTTIPDSVTSIGYSAFRSCRELISVTISDSVMSIDNDAFYDCSNIATTYYSGKPEQWNNISIGSNNDAISENIVFECNSEKPYYCKGTCGDNLTWTLYTDGNLMIDGTGDMTDYNSSSNVPWYSKHSIIKSVIIDNGVTSIGNGAFSGCSGLQELSFPVTAKIYNSPDVFKDCTNIKKITLTKGTTGIMPDYGNNTSTSSSTTYYRYTPWYISGCSEIVLQSGIKTIGQYAFYNCTNISTVQYEGTSDEFFGITIKSYNEPLFDATINFNFYSTKWICGDAVEKRVFRVGDKLVPPDMECAKGYAIADWTPEIPDTMPADNLTFTAVLKLRSYNVEWIVDDAVTEETVEFGQTISKPANPEKTGYTFVGWTPEIPETMPAKDMSFTAVFKANSYNAVFNANGGAWSDGETTKTVSTAFDSEIIAPEAPTKQGYIFSGWSPEVGTMDDVNGKAFNAVWIASTDIRYSVETYTMNTEGEYIKTVQSYTGVTDSTANAEYTVAKGFSLNEEKSVLSGVISADNSLILKVYIDRNKYKFTTVVDGAATETEYLYGSIIAEPAAPVKTGYTFAGWDKVIPATMPAEDFTVTARFTANSYNAVFDANGGKWSGGATTKTVATDFGSNIVAPANPTRQGYDFAGWDSEIGKMDDVNGKTFSANWTVRNDTKYTVEIYTMDAYGKYSSSKETNKGTTDTEVSVTANAQTGFTVNSTKSNLSGNISGDGSLVLRIYYDRNKYKLITNIDGNTTSKEYYYDASVSMPANPYKPGYKFIGWDKTIPSKMPANDVTVTAVFEQILFTMSIRNPSTTTIKYGDKIILHADMNEALPSGWTIKWTADNGNFSYSVSADGSTCTISPSKSGSTSFKATVYDENGNVFCEDTQSMTSKAGFFDKIGAFFRKLFGSTKTIPQLFKGIF